MKWVLRILVYVITPILPSMAQQAVSKVWVADNGKGFYKNPVLHADYSDPDAIRVGDDFYMIASSFNHVPGLPILHSKDLVNWSSAGYALQRQTPIVHFSVVQHGGGVWAPSIRYHNNGFYIYYPDPDFGIYLIRAKKITGPWSEPLLVAPGKGLIDPCPLWDDDGRVYLVHAYAGSRAGIKSVIVIKELNAEGTKVLNDGVLVYDGHEQDPTIEGPKLYKRNGYYYIFAPAGGVSTGWQVVLRSKNIYGPYERKVVMDQGATTVNGPHQGAWVNTQSGEDWFLHFQDKGAYGRVVHLQPVQWRNDWPVIGADKDGDGKGEPVLFHKKPSTGKEWPVTTPPDSDEFDSWRMGWQWQWQWQANPLPYWAFLAHGYLRLFSYPMPDTALNCWQVPNLLLQKFPAEEFMVTTKMNLHLRWKDEKAGLIIFGTDYATASVVKKDDNNYISFSICRSADKGTKEEQTDIEKLDGNEIYLRVQVRSGGVCSFSYSTDGKLFTGIGEAFTAKPGKWVGAAMGLFCTRALVTNDAGYADVDWFRVEPVIK